MFMCGLFYVFSVYGHMMEWCGLMVKVISFRSLLSEFQFQLHHFVGRSLVGYLNFSSFVILSVKNAIMIESSS